MKNVEFFNLYPEEVEVLRLRFTMPGMTISDTGRETGWGSEVVKKNEELALQKIRTGLKNCGVVVSNECLRYGMAKGVFTLPGIVENEQIQYQETDEQLILF